MSVKISGSKYAAMYGPTVGDKVRLADTSLVIEVEKDYTTYGDEVKFGGGKSIRDGMGQSVKTCSRDGDLDLVITNALIMDATGIVKADIGIKDGKIAGIGKAGNPDVMDGVTPGMTVGASTEALAVMAQLGTPDMKLPIQYALYYPERRFLAGDRLDFAALTQITFEKPDMDTFLGLPMAMQASRTGGSMPTVFNAANERAVALFLAKKIRFLEIYDVIAGAMEAHKTIADPTLEQILAAEQETYEWIANRYKMGE